MTINDTTMEALKALEPEDFKVAIINLYEYDGMGKEPEKKEGAGYAVFLLLKPPIDARRSKREKTKHESEPKPEPEPEPKPKPEQGKWSSEINEIVTYLNTKTGKSFRESTPNTRAKIIARLNDGYSVDEIKHVIDVKAAEWKGTDMEPYLRPDTLFGGKFEGYLQQKQSARRPASGNRFTNFEQRAYDYDELERKLFEKSTAVI